MSHIPTTTHSRAGPPVTVPFPTGTQSTTAYAHQTADIDPTIVSRLLWKEAASLLWSVQVRYQAPSSISVFHQDQARVQKHADSHYVLLLPDEGLLGRRVRRSHQEVEQDDEQRRRRWVISIDQYSIRLHFAYE